MAITGGSLLNSVPAPQKQTLETNYIDFTASGIPCAINVAIHGGPSFRS